MHSDRGANPLDPDVIKHKELTSKRKKTDDDHRAIAKSEWLLALYWDKKNGPYIPSMNVRASLIGGAKFNKLGTHVKRSTLLEIERIPLEYDGPRNIKGLFDSGNFIDTRSVVVMSKRLMRNRPVFQNWSLVFEMSYDEKQLEERDLMTAFKEAGKLIGIGDFRPEKGGLFGRYSVKKEK